MLMLKIHGTIALMDFAFSDNYRFLARYNRWFNQRLYAACDGLSDTARKQDRGAFFGSIHRTLNHLLVADQVWLRRFVDCGTVHSAVWPMLTDAIRMPPHHPLNQPLHADWNALRTHRETLDAALEAWLADAPADMPSWTMAYANSQGTQRQHPLWQALTHFFNHQTHHRGQVTTLLSQQGVDIGVTDLIALSDTSSVDCQPSAIPMSASAAKIQVPATPPQIHNPR